MTHEANDWGCPWLIVTLVRSAIATLVALLLSRILGVRLAILRPRMLWLRSLAGSASMLTTFYALGHMLVSDVLTITNTFPIWIALLSWPLAGERPTRGVWLAVICSVTGVAVALQPSEAGFRWEPAIAAFAASFFSAVAMLGINRLKGVAPIAVVVHFSAVSSLVCLPVLIVQKWLAPEEWKFESLQDHHVQMMLLAVGITAAAGQFFLTRAYAAGSPTKVSVVALSQVLIVMAVEAMLGRKSITIDTVVGTALVLGPVGWLLARERRPVKEEVAIE